MDEASLNGLTYASSMLIAISGILLIYDYRTLAIVYFSAGLVISAFSYGTSKSIDQQIDQ